MAALIRSTIVFEIAASCVSARMNATALITLAMGTGIFVGKIVVASRTSASLQSVMASPSSSQLVWIRWALADSAESTGPPVALTSCNRSSPRGGVAGVADALEP